MYRSTPTPTEEGHLVTLRRYLDPLAAQMARTHLSARGINAHVIEAASYNPVLANALGGAQLQVSERDVERAEEVLASGAPGEDAPLDDGEEPGVVRCPRCELAYCFYERSRMRVNSPVPLAGFLAGILSFVPSFLFGLKRWHCHRCGHLWDNPKEGPAAMTQLEPGEPRPVFRLRRGHGGMGLFLGLCLGLFGGLIVSSALPLGMSPVLGPAILLGAPLLGWLIGRQLRYDLCSEPECRALLPPDVEDCARCKGSLAGIIHRAEEHFSSAADVRREIAALRKEPKKKAKARKLSAAQKADAGLPG